jgi:hypothetical protein
MIAAIETHDRDLARQLKRCASSIALGYVSAVDEEMTKQLDSIRAVLAVLSR